MRASGIKISKLCKSLGMILNLCGPDSPKPAAGRFIYGVNWNFQKGEKHHDGYQ
jgi:hypothetical protein